MSAAAPPRPSRWQDTQVAALLGLAAVLVAVRTARQLLPLASFALAVLAMFIWGRVVARRLGAPALGPWSAVYLGQFALLAAALPVLALNGAAHALTGYSLPLRWIVVPATAALAAFMRRDRGPSFGPAAPPFGPAPGLLALLGAGAVATAVAIYSRHFSALGLDVHQHLAWTRRIVMDGHVPLVEAGTRILADYPRGFHLLAALWNAAGFGGVAGPFVKTMPFLQNALPVLALAEALAGTERPAGRARQAAIGLGFFTYAFLLVPMLYPVFDLIGTARFSSNGVLLLPVVLLVVARAHGAPTATRAAFAVLPLAAALALTMNPVTAVHLVVAGIPVALAAAVVLRPPLGAGGARAALRGAAVASLLGALLLAQDPWIATQVAARSAPVAALLSRAGAITFDEAVREGRATARDKMVHPPASPVSPCGDLRCVAALAFGAAQEAAGWPRRALESASRDLARLAAEPTLASSKRALHDALPLHPWGVGDHAALPFLAIVLAGAALALVNAARRLRDPRLGPAPLADRLLLAALIGLLVATVLNQFAGRLAARLSDGSHEGRILEGYLGIGGSHLAIGFLWLAFGPAWAVLAEPVVRRFDAQPAGRRAPRALVVVGLALWLALPSLGALNARGRRHPGFGGAVGAGDLLALRQIEKAIPRPDGVLVPASHWNIADWEHWVIPEGPTTALLPYGDRRYLFNVYLGASYPFSWRDLVERACSDDPAERARFLDRASVRWFMVLDRGAEDGAAAARRTTFCGSPLEAYGVEQPPVRAEGLWLFRLRGR